MAGVSGRYHIDIRSGWRCINDGLHDWRSDDKYRRNGKRCNRCHCLENAPAIWIITARHPVHGVIQKHCDSFAEALEVVNRPSPVDSLYESPTIRFGHALYAT